MTVEEQEKIVLAYRVSGKTMKVWTAENGMDYRKFSNFRWQYNKRRGLCKKQSKKKMEVVELLPIKPQPSVLTIEIGECRISVDEATNMDLLKKVSQVLSNA